MNENEIAIIRAFITAARRKRWLESLASAKRRVRMLDRLNHCRDLDDRYTTSLMASPSIEFLRSRGAPATCYVMSSTSEIDGQELPLEEAISRTELGGWGTIISFIPGRLAYYHDECGERRMLLARADELVSRDAEALRSGARDLAGPTRSAPKTPRRG